MAFGGTWNSADPPSRGGVFINVEAVAIPRAVPDTSGIVGVVGTADWGPANVIQEISSEAEAEFYYGTGGTMKRVITQALLGQGSPGRGGASVVKAFRAAAVAKAKATISLMNTTPAAALRLDALYFGTRANDVKVVVRTNALDATKKDILLYEGTILRETYSSLLATDTVAMAAAINSQSRLVAATSLITGVALTNVVAPGTAMTGGVSGSTLTTTEHETARNAFEADGSFSVFAVDNMTDVTETALYVAWAERINSEGKLMVMVIGGLAGELATTAITRTTTADSPYVVNLYGDLVIDEITYSSAEMASWVAGVIANAGYSRPIIFTRHPDARMSVPPSTVTTETLVDAGVVPFVADANGVMLQRGRTTLRTTTASEPVEFQSLLFLRKTQHTFRELSDLGVEIISTGGFVNTEIGRSSLLSRFQATIDELVAANVAVPGSAVYADPAFSSTGEAIYLIFAVSMAPGIEQILGRMTIPTTLAA